MTNAATTVTTDRPQRDEDILALMADLTDRRVQLGLNRTLVAARMESTASVLSALERCTRVPQVYTLRRWAHALGLELEFTLRGPTEPPRGNLRLFDAGPQLDRPHIERDEDVVEIMRVLTARRSHLGISRTLVAARMESTASVLGELERCIKAPTVHTLRRWAQAVDYDLEISLRELTETERGNLRLVI